MGDLHVKKRVMAGIVRVWFPVPVVAPFATASAGRLAGSGRDGRAAVFCGREVMIRYTKTRV